jgi:RNA polymerase sigma-70 factor (ECF subfamily)
LYRRHAQLVHGYLLRRTHDPELAADLTQDTFVKATRSLPGWSGGTAEGWLLAIARSVLIDHARRTHVATVPLADDEELGSLLPVAATAPDQVVVGDALDRLPAQHAKLLRLAYIDGFRPAEIAAMAGTSDGNVRMALHRARAAFREAWTDKTDEEDDR